MEERKEETSPPSLDEASALDLLSRVKKIVGEKVLLEELAIAVYVHLRGRQQQGLQRNE